MHSEGYVLRLLLKLNRLLGTNESIRKIHKKFAHIITRIEIFFIMKGYYCGEAMKMPMDKDYRVGCIGCGSVLIGSHMPSHAAIRMYGDKLVGFYDVDVKKAEMAKRIYTHILQDYIDGKTQPFIRIWGYQPSQEEITEKYKESLAESKVYKDVEELFENVDVVDVCTPPPFHVDYAVMALEHNVHVATEKPMGRTWWEARKIVEALKKSKAKYQLSDNNAYSPSYLVFKKAMDSGAIGDVNYIEFYRGHWIGKDNQPAWFWNAEAGGGAMLDYGCHGVTIAQYLAGFDAKVLSVKSEGIRKFFKHRPAGGLFQEIKVEDDVRMKILFEDPKTRNWITAFFQAGWTHSVIGTGDEYGGHTRIIGSKGELTAYQDEERNQYVKVTKAGYGEKLLPVPPPVPREATINAVLSFLRVLNDGKVPFTNEKYGLTNMAIMGAAFLSELRGRTAVTLAEFAEFCEETAKKCKKEEEIPLAIIRELTKPYQ